MRNIYTCFSVQRYLLALTFCGCLLVLGASASPVVQDTITKRICGKKAKEFINFDGNGKKYKLEITSSNRRVAYPDLPYNGVTNSYGSEVTTASIPIVTRSAGVTIFAVHYACSEPNCVDSGIEYVKVEVCYEGNELVGLPPGEAVISDITIEPYSSRLTEYDHSRRFSVTNRCVYAREEVGFLPLSLDFSRKLWCAPEGRFIESFQEKRGKVNTFLVLLDDGSVYELRFINNLLDIAARELLKTSDVVQSGTRFIKVIGDDIYVMTDKGVLVTRDNGISWQVDTNGLGGAVPADITLDEDQNVYCATNKGLFKQMLTSSTWEKVAAHPAENLVSVYIDRKQRMFTSTYGLLRKSDDRGMTWALDTAGAGLKTVAKFGDDIFGNIYAITQGTTPTAIYRSQGGTGAWERIDADIVNKTDPAYSTSVFFAIGGDTVISLSSTYGIFFSKDQGTTWTYNKTQAPAENIASLLKTSDGKAFVSTNTGIYFGQLGDTTWLLRNPRATFNYARPLYRDNSGTLYSTGAKRTGGFGIFAFDNILSTDNGLTWKPDTAGLWQVNQGTYFVDENGTQYIFQFGNGSNLAKIYTKKPGGSWQADMAGFTPVSGAAFEQSSCWASDRKGTVYMAETVSGKGTLWKRTGSGNWETDTAGLNGAIVYSVVRDSAGNLYAGASAAGILRKSVGGSWQSIPYPKAVPASAWVFFVAVDTKGTLFATFASFDANFNFHGNGVYFTKDNGLTWRSAGLNGIASNGFVAYGDTVYAFQNSHGLYALTAREYSTAMWNPNVLNFGKVTVGSSLEKNGEAYNYGNIEGIATSAMSDNPAFSLSMPPNTTIAPGNHTAFAIQFRPTTKGKTTGVIVLTSTGENKSDTLFLEGEGSESSAVEENQIAEEVMILPNPAKDIVLLSTATALLDDITLYDATGREIWRQPSHPMQERIAIDVSWLPKGWYRISIGTKSAQFIKQ